MGLAESKRWAMTPGLILDDVVAKKISSEALALYCIIRAYWGGFAAVFPKQETIVNATGFSRAKVQRLLKELNDSGWILSERQSRTYGNNQYFICDEPFVKPKTTAIGNALMSQQENEGE